MPGSLNQSKTLISGRFDVEGNEKHLNEKLTCNKTAGQLISKFTKKLNLDIIYRYNNKQNTLS